MQDPTLDDQLNTIALTAQILSPTPHPSIVGNLGLTGAEEQEYVRQAFEVNDDLEKNVEWVMESREAQRILLEKWLGPIVAGFMRVFFSGWEPPGPRF